MSINYPWICLNFLYGILVSCWNMLGSETLTKTGYRKGFRSFKISSRKFPKRATNYINSLSFYNLYNSLLINSSLFCVHSKQLTALSSKEKTTLAE